MDVYTENYRAWARYDGGEVALAQAKDRWNPQKRAYGPTNPQAKPSIFVKNEHNKWVCVNPAGMTTRVVSRKGANAVRARYAEGISYVNGLAKLRKDDWPDMGGFVAAFRDTLLKRVPDSVLSYNWHVSRHMPTLCGRDFEERHAKQFIKLLGSSAIGDHYKAFLWCAWGGPCSDILRDRLDKALMRHHRDEWFKEVQHEPGVKAIDKYARLFHGGG
jgi:hypothetical protein